MKRVLLTGAGGGIGGRLRRLLPPAYDLRLSDLRAPQDLRPEEEFVAADLADIVQVERAADGMDGIIHFGAQSVEADWDTILKSNIHGTYNLFEAARRKGVKRVVFASTNHVVGFYPRDQRVGTDVTLLPDTRYGVSKACGEALGALYAYKYELDVLCLRIGNVSDGPTDLRLASIWLKPEDLVQLIRIGLDHPDLRYEIFYGASANTRGWWDNSDAYRYGYKPTGDSETMLRQAREGQARRAPDPVGDYYQGGPFASAEFEGGVERVRDGK
ncbi:MAG TPA: NAD(P)-dependent oxidoreductase [Dongiaceae bacterium]|nr:NAD(P)-dependent oxidoreductase [Dongiaceae bacterium]